MAPIKNTRNKVTIPSTTTTRNGIAKPVKTNVVPKQARVKRKADASPVKGLASKRPALGDISNVKNNATDTSKPAKKITTVVKSLASIKTVIKPRQNENSKLVAAPLLKVNTRASSRTSNIANHTATIKPKQAVKENIKIKTRLSDEFEKTQDSLYSTALEDVNDSNVRRTRSQSLNSSDAKCGNVTLVALQLEQQLNLGVHKVPVGVADFDKEHWNDVYQVSQYTMDIFNYLKSRESQFAVPDYIYQQKCITLWMRSLLVDWMVEIQESFELNHETLYLGVKLVDTYLSKVIITKELLQLVGAASVLIASKYDERLPPLIDDFLYICDGAYTRKELIRMEFNLLKVCNYDLGIPLSYRFLRRYARCAKVTMPVLTLARFILEYSLMDYATIQVLESKLAAASLYLALQMKRIGGWNATLEFYSGYKLDEILSTVYLLNGGLHRKPKEQLMTIRNKYSHKIFFEVAKTPLVKNEDLK